MTQAEANLARDMAQLENARVEEQRYRKLVEGGFVAREQYDQFRTKELTLAATIDADRAAVDTAKALVRADEAAVENVRVQLATPRSARPSAAAPATCSLHQGNVVKANDVGNPHGRDQPHPPDLRGLLGSRAQLDAIKRYRARR